MIRIGLLSTIALMLVSPQCSAQFGGMGGMGGDVGGNGQETLPGMIMGRRGMFVPGSMELQRSVQVEMEGGQRLVGRIDLMPLIVDSDLGRYSIAPDKIKLIRFLKPANDSEPEANGQGVVGADGMVAFQKAQGRGGAMRPVRMGGGGIGGGNPPGMAVLTRGKVTTSTDKEIIGSIHIPTDFRLDLDFGTLSLSPGKLRSITFLNETGKDRPALAGATAPATPGNVGGGPSSEAISPPRYFRQNSTLIVVSPLGERVQLYDLETRQSHTLELPASKDAPLEVTPVSGRNIVALRLFGPRITRIAVADPKTGAWYPQDLRTPVSGRALPVMAEGIVVYRLGRSVYAYGAEAKRWGIVELPDGIRAIPSLGPGTASIEYDGQIDTFTASSASWDHVDVRAILDDVGADKK